jgi:hypothetical protein
MRKQTEMIEAEFASLGRGCPEQQLIELGDVS